MKYLFFLVSLILNCLFCSAQTHADKKFIRFAIGKERVLYADKINAYRIKEFKEAFSKDTLFDWKYYFMHEAGKKLPDSVVLILNAAERAFIYQELDKMKDVIWKDNVLKYSFAFNKEKNEKYKEKHNGKSFFDTRDFNRNVYGFTKPIYIRNKTICIIYITQSCGIECGGGNLNIYVKEKGQWKLRLTPYYWVS